MRSYYFLNFAICAVLVLPMLWMTEVTHHTNTCLSKAVGFP